MEWNVFLFCFGGIGIDIVVIGIGSGVLTPLKICFVFETIYLTCDTFETIGEKSHCYFNSS